MHYNIVFIRSNTKKSRIINDVAFYNSGWLDDRSKPIIFSMARLDQVKNITGLVKMFGKCARLRELANLVVVAGYNNVKRSTSGDLKNARADKDL